MAWKERASTYDELDHTCLAQQSQPAACTRQSEAASFNALHYYFGWIYLELMVHFSNVADDGNHAICYLVDGRERRLIYADTSIVLFAYDLFRMVCELAHVVDVEDDASNRGGQVAAVR